MLSVTIGLIVRVDQASGVAGAWQRMQIDTKLLGRHFVSVVNAADAALAVPP